MKMKANIPPSITTLLLSQVVMLILCNVCLGQETAARPDRGIMTGASYAVSNIENISLTSGNLNLSIPLVSLPPIAGGKLKFTLSAVYNSKLWNVTRHEQRAGLAGTLSGCSTWIVDTPQLSDWGGGWRIQGGYSIVFREAHEDFDYIVPQPPNGSTDCESDITERTLLQNIWYRAVLIEPNGAEHELRPTDGYVPYVGARSYLFNYYKDIPNTVNAPMRYYTFDGSYLSATINPNSSYSPSFSSFYPESWTVYTNDGTRIIESNGIQRITDTNGNSIKMFGDTSYFHYQDEQTGREIKVNDTSIQYQTVGGTWETISIVGGTTTVQGKAYKVNDWRWDGGEEGMGTVCLKTVTLQATIPVIRQITFPSTKPGESGLSYTFGYNSDATESATDMVQWECNMAAQTYTRTASRGMGALSQMVTPSGAIVEYSYSRDSVHNLSDEPDDIPKETVTQKKVTHDGATDTWFYNIDEWGGTGGSVTAPDGSTTSETSYPHNPAVAGWFGMTAQKGGLVYRSSRSGQEVVERHWVLTPFSGANTGSTAGTAGATFNPVVDAEYTTLKDANGQWSKMSAKTFLHDYNGNVVQEVDYDWFDPTASATLVTRDAAGVPTGVPSGATVVRTIANAFYNDSTSPSSGNVYAKRSLATATPLILSALQQSTVGPAITQYSYDGQLYNVAPIVGNLTSQSSWDDMDGKWITSSQTFGAYGNVATATDARGKITQLFYDDATHAVPNRVVVDPQNGSGTQTAATAFDYSTGAVTSQTDVNGNIATIDYTNQLLGAVDPFARPGVITGPLVTRNSVAQHHRTTTTYFDTARQVVGAADLNAENDQLLKSRTTSDMLGRVVLSEQSEDGTSYPIYGRKAYDQMGKITYASNPMRASATASDGWTRVTSDNLGRVTEVATFGGSAQPPASGTNSIWTGSVATVYDANYTTVTDQAGKQRRSKVDALGRLVRVDEPNTANSLGANDSPVQPTSYTYSALGSLLNVVQGAQTRTFTYDSLSRLRSAVNPENGTINYSYDDNGNLTQKSDALHTSNYVYDALNRAVTRSYSDSTPSVAYTYDAGSGVSNPKGKLISVASSVATYSYSGYDAAGQVNGGTQTLGSNSYTLSYAYDLAGHVKSTSYPSGRVVTNAYDNAGRLNSVSGNLGDGTSRTYSAGIIYDAGSRMQKEQFGTDTPVYNKLFYNSRGQLAEIRESTSYTGSTDVSWNRGAIINHYSDQCWGLCSGQGMSDNNGNLRKQDNYIPDNDALPTTNFQTYTQSYGYDSLNRLQSVAESKSVNGGSGVSTWTQGYTYDRFGNRSINQSGTTQGVGINSIESSVVTNTTTNRMYAPGETEASHPLIDYDAVGNQKKDHYGTAGVNFDRTYDAENRMITSTAVDSLGTHNASYAYDADGRRVKRTVSGVETWQVYGLGGELLAEYPVNGPAASPQKEYGYRNGQLLITADAPTSTNYALATNGATASASSILSSSFSASATINGDRKGTGWGSGGGWADATSNTFPDSLEIDFSGTKTINEIDVFTLQDSYSSPAEPTETMTFSSYGLSEYTLQYWDGSAWQSVPGGHPIANNKVWTRISFAAITTSKIKVVTNDAVDHGYSRVTEVEAWGSSTPQSAVNVALSTNGATASASSILSSSFPASATINGDRKGTNWGSGGGWADSTSNSFPDWLQIDFSGSKTINEIDVFTLQDSYASPAEPTETMTFSTYGLSSYDVQYWDGSAWVTVTGGGITSNNKVWKKISFTALSTTKIRVWTHGSVDSGYSRITEVEAWSNTEASGTTSASINWLVTDQLGTPRMIFDKTGSLANARRHDYLPFGEELYAGQGGRAATQGYGANDGVRQKFTQKERDIETGLDWFGPGRYYSSVQGRFTSVDPLGASAKPANPQTWNRYTYVWNRPTIAIDPDGLSTIVIIVSPRSSGGTGNATLQVFDRNGHDVNVRNQTNRVDGRAVGQGQDRTVSRNDTPFGVYSTLPNYNGSNANGTQGGTAGVSARGEDLRFGTGIIAMQPVSGEVADNNRSAIYIHGGGRPLDQSLQDEQPLTATEGCVRVHNNDINTLITTVNDLATNHDPISNIFIGDTATINSQADERDDHGNYRYTELRAAGFGSPDAQGRPTGNRPTAEQDQDRRRPPQ
jgi:RHS repeat-associated protein